MYLFIINPSSGKGAAITIWRKVEKILLSTNIPFETHICESPELTGNYINEKIDSQLIRVIVVIGGDGTVSSVLQQLPGTNIPLAVLPAGSGNDIARNFDLIADPERFVAKLVDGQSKLVDLLVVNGLYGVTVAGIGLDAKIGMRADRSIYKRWLNSVNRGSDAYTIAAIIELLTFKSFHGKLVVDGRLVVDSNLWLVANGNLKMYGGGLVICPYADPTDGQINITLLHDATRWKVMTSLFPALLKGKPVIAKEVTYLTGKEISFEGDQVLPYIIDGEVFHSKKVQISIRPEALRLITTS